MISFKCPVCGVTKNKRGEPFSSEWAVASHIAGMIAFDRRHTIWAQTKVPGIDLRLKGKKLGNELMGAVHQEIEADRVLQEPAAPTQAPPSGARKLKERRISRREPGRGNRTQQLSPAVIRELERRLRDLRDPVRYMLVSEFSRRFILYYNVSSGMFTMNDPRGGTLFKRRQAAEGVKKILGKGITIVKYTTKGGKLKRLSPYRARWIGRRRRAAGRA